MNNGFHLVGLRFWKETNYDWAGSGAILGFDQAQTPDIGSNIKSVFSCNYDTHVFYNTLQGVSLVQLDFDDSTCQNTTVGTLHFPVAVYIPPRHLCVRMN